MSYYQFTVDECENTTFLLWTLFLVLLLAVKQKYSSTFNVLSKDWSAQGVHNNILYVRKFTVYNALI